MIYSTAEPSNLRKLQLIELQILKEFIRICEEHQLRYYVIGGTALGAVRHKGFIPWDDDIDVSMPREDYNHFEQIAEQYLSQRYTLQREKDSESIQPFMQIFDRKIMVVTEGATIPRRGYAWLDIFPLDGLPNAKTTRFFHTRYFILKRMLFHLSVFKQRVDQRTDYRPLHEKIVIWVCNRLDIQRLFNKEKRILSANRLVSKYSFYKSNHCIIPWGAFKLKDIFPMEWFGDGVTLPFEDIEVVAPVKYKQYLEQIYEDYMTPPPEDKRNKHALTIVSIKE